MLVGLHSLYYYIYVLDNTNTGYIVAAGWKTTSLLLLVHAAGLLLYLVINCMWL